MASRLTLAIESGGIALPEEGRIAVFGPRAGTDLSALPQDRLHVIQGFRPDHDAFARQGYATSVRPEGHYAAALVFVPRSKSAARARVGQARQVTGGPIFVDGQKTDGIDSILRAMQKRAATGAAFAKAHGKIMEVRGGDFSDWFTPDPTSTADGYFTLPGVFSADGADPGSQMLAACLPPRLPARIADLGAGWGYLARAVFDREGVAELDLVEADFDALECAQLNVADPRARFHWADVNEFTTDRPYDMVISNPPFHVARDADPALGHAFIDAARRLLAPGGQLWLVANRHLPYERSLNRAFRTVKKHRADRGFKVFHATGPVRSIR